LGHTLPIFTDLVAILRRYLDENITRLDSYYDWDLPDSFPLLPNESPARATIRLRHELSVQWKAADASERERLAEWYVTVWGRVNTRKTETISSYANNSPEAVIQNNGFKGIASWSKVLAMREPTKFAIYDSRVAVALNSLQIVSSNSSWIAFRIPPWRKAVRKDGIMDLAAKAIRAAHASVTNLQKIPGPQTYAAYLSILHELSRTHGPIEEIEMLLFARGKAIADNMLKHSEL